MSRLAEPLFGVALNTTDAAAHRAFWHDEIGLPYDECLAIGEGAHQDRYDLGGAVLKVCVYPSVPPAAPSGYHELIIARRGEAHRRYAAPDGERVSLVEPGQSGVDRIGLRMAVRNRAAHQEFFSEALGFALDATGHVSIGNGRLIFEEQPDAPADAGILGPGWRCLTIQIADLDMGYERAVAHGARVAIPPSRFGDTALYSMIRDPDGNWIELSQALG